MVCACLQICPIAMYMNVAVEQNTWYTKKGMAKKDSIPKDSCIMKALQKSNVVVHRWQSMCREREALYDVGYLPAGHLPVNLWALHEGGANHG
ncbi:MAG: hypothetical protein ACTJLL_02135 [Anaplasma sp.]